MSEAPRFHDESLMPLTMGSPYRVASYAYPNWGLTYTGEEQALAAYNAEWASGGQDQMNLVEEASEAVLGSYPQLLRTSAAGAASQIMQGHTFGHKNIVVLDIGAGPGLSGLEIFRKSPPEIQNRLVIMLLDPSSKSLAAAEELMTENKATYGILKGTDSESLPTLPNGFADIITGVASIHHHSEIPFAEHLRVLKPGGSAIYPDWHQDIWLYPGGVLRFLEAFDEEEWPRREEGLRHWVEVYPQALETPTLSDDPKDVRARDEITRFWKAYAKIVRERGVNNELWPLEGHRPAQEYVWSMREAGFKQVVSRPLLDYSSLLQVTVGQKAA